MRIFLIIAMLVFSLQAKSFFSNDKQAEASEYIAALKDLIVATQRCRGATGSYLNGNETAIDLVYNYRSDMKKAIGTMESLPMSQNAMINGRAASVSRDLTSLNSKALDLTSAQSFNGYTKNLAQALMLAQTVSKQFTDLNDFGNEAVKLMLEVILPLSENMGQLRALGSGSSARARNNTKQIAQMKAILRNIESLNASLQSDSMAILSRHKEAYSTDLSSRLLTADRVVKDYVSLTRKEILLKKVNYSSSEYFSTSTNAIDDVIIIFDINRRAILKDSDGWI